MDVVQDQLNLNDVGAVAQPLRAALEQEKERLMEDIEFLQKSMEEESEVRTDLQVQEMPCPSTEELREFSSKLQTHLLKQESSRALHDSLGPKNRWAALCLGGLLRRSAADCCLLCAVP